MSVEATTSRAPESLRRDGRTVCRPRLAPDVELVGPFQGGGFEHQVWLVKRGERFVQLPEIAYRTLERCDGTRSVVAVAKDLTESTPWDIEPEVVQKLIDSKLEPLRLVAGDDDEASEAAHSDGDAASLFKIHLKRRVLEAATIDRVAAPLRLLFSPIVVVPVLLASVAVRGWLYLAHPVTQPIAQVIRNPELFLVVVALALATAVFHEFGHAAALRYGGGRARAMGFGFYLMFPAFYTNVTDGYRLSRGARIRTDLGGVYFHLVASLAVAAMSAALHAPFLLFVVVLLDLEVVRQLFPLVRMDGYWLLADITGAPNPLALATPMILRILRKPGASSAPRLKPRIERIYVAYLALSLVVLPTLLVITLSRLPTIASLIWGALRVESMDLWRSATTAFDLLALTAGVVHVLLLLLQLAGAIAFVYFVVWRPVARGWMWSGRQAMGARRVVRAAILTGLGGGLLMVGALMTWRSAAGLFDPGIRGTSLWTGRVCLGSGIALALVALAIVGFPGKGRLTLATLILTATIGLGISALEFRAATNDAIDAAVEHSVRSVSGRDATAGELRQFRSVAGALGLSPTTGLGPYVAIGGCALAMCGGLFLVSAVPPKRTRADPRS